MGTQWRKRKILPARDQRPTQRARPLRSRRACPAGNSCAVGRRRWASAPRSCGRDRPFGASGSLRTRGVRCRPRRRPPKRCSRAGARYRPSRRHRCPVVRRHPPPRHHQARGARATPCRSRAPRSRLRRPRVRAPSSRAGRSCRRVIVHPSPRSRPARGDFRRDRVGRRATSGTAPRPTVTRPKRAAARRRSRRRRA